MRRGVHSIAIVACFPLAAAVLMSSISPGSPDVRPYSSTVVTKQMGEPCEGESLRLLALVDNPLLVPLTVAAVRPDCGCAPVEDDYAGRVIPPGETLEIAATYGAHSPGEFSRAITVDLQTPDGEVIRRQWRFTGTVLKQMSVTPAFIQSDEAGGTHTSVIELAFGGPLECREVQLHPPGDYAAEFSSESADRGVVTITPTSDEAGEYSGTVFVRLTAPQAETVTVPVRIGGSLKTEPTLARNDTSPTETDR